MDPEERVVIVVEGLAVKFAVFLVGTIFGRLQIQRLRVVERLIVFAPEIQIDIVGHEGAVFFDERADGALFQKLLLLFGDVHDDLGAALLPVARLDRISAFAVRLPADGGSALAVRLGADLDILGDHVRRIEAEAEVPDDAFAARLLVLFQKVGRARKGDLGDVLFHLLLVHADAVVFHAQCAGVFVDGDLDAVLRIVCRGLAEIDELFEFRDGVDAVCHDLAQKNVLIRIQPLFDDGHHVFAGYTDVALFSHINTSCRKKPRRMGAGLCVF